MVTVPTGSASLRSAERQVSWHRSPVPAAPSPRVSYPAVAEAVSAARKDVVRIARDAGASESELVDMGLAVSEAATNAILYAESSPGTPGETFAVSTACDGSLFTVWVIDDGRGFEPAVPSTGLGWGLGLMGRLCERFVIGVLSDGRTQVEMRFELGVTPGT
jgi:anti-sigma regulatory factor (Ser/Thr protein kinase)